MSLVKKYTNLSLTQFENLNLDWSRSGDKNASSMHSISSYLAMFAPALPKFFIETLTKKGDLVMDPFSGRGTTALKSREMNRRFIGSDLNPYAIVLSRAKINVYSIDELFERLSNIESKFYIWKKNNMNIHRRKEYSELLIYYSPKVLRQLIYFREELGRYWENIGKIDNAILAFTLGLMNGPMKKDGKSIYFSLSMSNSISMSPRYVSRYSKDHNLKKPNINIFEKIKNRINKKYDNLLNTKNKSSIFLQNATKENILLEDNSVDLVVTSPPYLSIVNYTNTNWLKLWLLGYERKNLKKDIKLSDTLKINDYIIFITKFLNAIYPKLKMGSSVCLVVGDVHETKLIENVWENISNNVSYQFESIYYDYGYSQNKKILNSMNKKKGKATIIEKVLVVKKV